MIPEARLHNQHITNPYAGTAANLVGRFGAVQAQEYPFAKWGLALRLGERVTDADIETAFTHGQILRTHVMRPTWHFVTAHDITWLLELTAPRVLAATTSYFQNHGLDRRTLARATGIIERALAGGRYLTRAELASELARRRIKLAPLQLGLVSLYAELERVICSGPRRGKQSTYALLSERVAAATASRPERRKTKDQTKRTPGDRDEALAELARRFLAQHGPATVRDFVWWSGLKSADARRGIDIIQAERFASDDLIYWTVGERERASTQSASVHLLPIYDEYLVAYRDRVAVPYGPATVRANGRAVAFRHALVSDGHVAGTWRTEQKQSDTVVHVTPVRPLRRAERRGIEVAAARYARFLESDLTLEFPPAK